MASLQVDTALGRLRVRSGGSGEAITFWPSLLMTGDMWQAQADHFGADRRVILIDPPGHGGSEKLSGALIHIRGMRAVRRGRPRRTRCQDHPLRRQLVGRIGRAVLMLLSRVTTPALETAAMARAIPGSRMVVLDGVAQLAGLENPGLVIGVIGDFLFGE